MSERLEKLFTLTDIENPPEAPVTIEAGGLIKDNKTGRVIARMYLKNCSDKPLSSVLVGFRPQGENGRAISGMRDYLYDASGVPVGEIFGDQTGIFFDNNDTRSFTAGVAEVDFEDGEYWDAVEAAKEAAKPKLIVPEEKEQTGEALEAWSKPVEQAKAPAVWESDIHANEKHSSEIYGAAIAEQKYEEPLEEEFVPASLETRQLEHEEKPALEEQTDAYREEQAKAVIELDGPSEDEGSVIELGGPVKEEETEEAEAELVEEEEAEEPETEPEEVPAEESIEESETEPAPAEPVEETIEEPEPEEEPQLNEEPVEEPVPEEVPEPEEPEGPVRLADMYGGIAAAGSLAALAAAYGRRQGDEAFTAEQVEPEPVTEVVPEEPVVTEAEEPVVTEAEEPVVTEAEVVEEPEVEPEPIAEEPVAEEPVPEEAIPEEPVAKPESVVGEPVQEHKIFNTEDIENPWAGYSADYAPPLGAVQQEHKAEEVPAPEEEVPEEPAESEPVAEEPAEEPAPVAAPYEPEAVETAPVLEAAVEPEAPAEAPAPEAAVEPEAPVEEPAPEAAEPEAPAMEEIPEEAAQEKAVEETPAAEELPGAEEHIPTIEETIELPKATVPEKSADDAQEILAALAAKEETEVKQAADAAEQAAEEIAEEANEEHAAETEEVNPVHQKADVVFAEENDVLPSLIDDSKEKALTGEDHSGRNLLNIVVFGGIALIILLVLLIKM